MPTKKEITKDDMFKLAHEMMSIRDEYIRREIMNLTALFNLEKDDSYYIPKAFVDSYRSAIVDFKENPPHDYPKGSDVAYSYISVNFHKTSELLWHKLKLLENNKEEDKKNFYITSIRNAILYKAPKKYPNNYNGPFYALHSAKNPAPRCRDLFFESEGNNLDLEFRNIEKDKATKDIAQQLMSMSKSK